MTTTPSPIEQFIQKLREATFLPCVPMNTDGPEDGCCRFCGEGSEGPCPAREQPGTPPWRIAAILESAVEGLRKIANEDYRGNRSRAAQNAHSTLAHLNTLAASALGTTGEK